MQRLYMLKNRVKKLRAVCNEIKKSFPNFVMYYNNEHKKQSDPIPDTTRINPLLIITKVG